MRTKSFISRRAWRCPIESEDKDSDVSLGYLPPMKISLEVPACSQEFAQLIQSRKGETRRLRKRVSQHLLMTKDTATWDSVAHQCCAVVA